MRIKLYWLSWVAVGVLICCKADDSASKQQVKALEQRVKRLEQVQAHPPLDSPIEKLKKAMAGVRQWANAVQSFSTDYRKYPKAAIATKREGTYEFCEVRQLGAQLFGYQPATPLDPWGNPYLYWCAKDRRHYMVVCTGADGRLALSNELQHVIDSRMRPVPLLPQVLARCFQDDLVWFDSEAVQFPADNVEDCEKK